jgi:hypothetical protein
VGVDRAGRAHRRDDAVAAEDAVAGNGAAERGAAGGAPPDAAADGTTAGDAARGTWLWLAFELPKGSYATTLLREVMKVDVDAPLDDGSSSGAVAAPGELDQRQAAAPTAPARPTSGPP